MEITQKKAVVMGYLRNKRGFSLVEMAIVLVIIGIIIGAIVKGQDLILNSRAKQVSTAMSTWRNLAMAFLDRNGRLPGDLDKSALIGDAAATEQVTGGTATDELVNTMTNAPNNPVTVGGLSFYMFFGNVPAAGGTFRNIIAVCKDVACSSTFTSDELEIIKTIDTGVDGLADAGLGQVRGGTVTLTMAGAGTNSGRSVAAITAGTVADVTVLGTTIPWSTTNKALIWAFDRPW